MLKVFITKQFKRLLKRYKYQNEILNELNKVVDLLASEKQLPRKYKDHQLKGKYKEFRELHLKPDDLLMYVKVDKVSITLAAIGSHSELFNS